MWKSIGDKFDVESHDDQKHPRKIKTNIFATIILIFVFLASSFTVREKLSNLIGSTDIYDSARVGLYATSIVVMLLLIFLKYRKNKRELDYALIMIAIILIFILIYVL